jgi:glutaredoxin
MSPPVLLRTVMAAVLLVAQAWIIVGAWGAEPPEADILVFTREGCPHCEKARQFLDRLQHERPGLRLIIRDVGEDRLALQHLKELAAQKGMVTFGVPAFYLRGELLIGYRQDTTGTEITRLLDQPRPRTEHEAAPGACSPEKPKDCEIVAAQATPEEGVETRWFGRLNARAMGLPAFTLALGLLDGFNPCAMWVLLFLLSLLVNLRDRRKMLVIASTFVAVSGLVYFAFMAAWLNVFVLIGLSRATEVALGGIAIWTLRKDPQHPVCAASPPSLGGGCAAGPAGERDRAPVHRRVPGSLHAHPDDASTFLVGILRLPGALQCSLRVGRWPHGRDRRLHVRPQKVAGEGRPPVEVRERRRHAGIGSRADRRPSAAAMTSSLFLSACSLSLQARHARL